MRPRFAALIPLVVAAASGVCGAQRVRQSPPPMLTAPAGVTATATPPSGVTVVWQVAFGAAQYQLLRSPDPTIPGTPIGSPTTAASTVDPVPLATVAYYQVVSIAADGRQIASSPVSYTPTTTAQIAGRGNSYATKVGPGPSFTGAPPVRLAVSSYNPSYHTLRWDWDGVHGVKHWQVYLRSLPSPAWQLVKDQLTIKGYDHLDFIAPNTATFRVVAVYPDGTQGVADIDYLNPPQPAPPAGWTGVQVSTGAVKFSWQPDPGATGYRLNGPTIAAPGLALPMTTSHVQRGIPVGTHQFSIASVYRNGKPSAAASASVAVRPTSATYRVTINGFLSQKASTDDPLSFDGHGDEVFLAAYWAVYPYRSRTVQTSGFAQTAVYGDANQAPTRIQAGTQTNLGGIRNSDLVPLGYSPVPQPGVAGYADRLPLLVWQGTLADSGDAVAIHPTIWESDRNASPNWATWQDWFTTPSGSGGLADAVQSNRSSNKAIQPIGIFTWSTTSSGANFPLAPGFNIGQGADRPIGISRAAGLPNENSLAMAGVVLSRERIERALGMGQATVIPFMYYDRLGLDGAYYLYLQIERLP